MLPPGEQDLRNTLTDPELRHFVALRARAQPTGTWTSPYPDTGGQRWEVPHAYIACAQAPIGNDFSDEQLAEYAALRADPRWEYREIPGNHLCLFYDP